MAGDEKAAGPGLIAGVDVGGTFTDLVLLDPASGRVRLAKTPTTPEDQSAGAMAALDMAGVDAAALALVAHGTTVTTNAVLERRLAKTGLVTTAGFRDVLELGRRTRPAPYGMKGAFRPVIPRDLRLEVPERMDAQGRVVRPLDEAAFAAAVQALRAAGCEALVVHFLHAYANPAHELRAGEIARGLWPNGCVTLAHALLAESREFERGVTAAVNAATQPLLDRYLARFAGALEARGYAGDLLVMSGNGGMVSARTIAREAAKTVMSGPATGAMAAAAIGRRAGAPHLITYDMGGTSTDVALIRDARPAVSSEIEVEYAMPIHLPMVDVRTVGAGGGSIARVDAAGLLRVGPESAGARPGPICYGRGGVEPTISDANLLLGRLNPEKLLAVDGAASVEAVRAVFAERLGAPLGVDAETAAAAVIDMADMAMAGATRMVSVSLGEDPRDFALFAFGGAGPLHAAAIARELGAPRVLVPARPGLTNALGCVVADLRRDFAHTLNRPLDALDMGVVAALFRAQLAEGRALIGRERVAVEAVRETLSVDMRFVGQTHLIRVPVEEADIGREALRARFDEVYFRRFRVRLDDAPVDLVNVNASVIGVRPALDLSALIDPHGRAETLEEARTGRRRVWFASGWRETPIYARERLPLDAEIAGPAILEQMDATTVIAPGDRATQDGDGNLHIAIAAETAP